MFRPTWSDDRSSGVESFMVILLEELDDLRVMVIEGKASREGVVSLGGSGNDKPDDVNRGVEPPEKGARIETIMEDVAKIEEGKRLVSCT